MMYVSLFDGLLTIQILSSLNLIMVSQLFVFSKFGVPVAYCNNAPIDPNGATKVLIFPACIR